MSAVRLQTLFRPYHRARRASDLDQVEIVADGVNLSTYVVGKGRPAVLLHGLGGSKISWVPFLAPLADHLSDYGIGAIAEIFDSDPPFTPNGCIAQAWSVAETLRAWHELSQA